MIEFKILLKRVSIYLIILLPIVLILTYLLGLGNVPVGFNILICVVTGGLLCLSFEAIRYVYLNNKEKKQEGKPKKKDPFSE